jgi:uncharacterized protein (TIGR02145 family)
MKEIKTVIIFIWLYIVGLSQVSGQVLYFKDSFQDNSSMNNWHHTTDYRGGGVFEVKDGQFQRTQTGHVFYYNDGFTSGSGVYSFKAKGNWVFFWRGTTESSSSGKALALVNTGGTLYYYECDWSGYVYGYHNNSRPRTESVIVGQYLVDNLNQIRITDDNGTVNIYVNNELKLSLVISQAYQNTGYIEIGANHYSEPVAFDDIFVRSLPANIQVATKTGWNLISIPVSVPDGRKNILFPDAVSSAFSYHEGYITKDTLVNGIGYWLKFIEDGNIPLYGEEIYTDTFTVKQGWNMIGSISLPVPVNTVLSEPSEIISSNYFGFTQGVGYEKIDTIQPGKGYWLKVKQDGLIILSSNINFECGISKVFYAGKLYNTVQIGSQCWLRENLDVGTMILGITNASNNGIIEKYCYNNDTNNCNTYGGLYQWNEAMQYTTTQGTIGICPPGWHIPTHAEYQILGATVSGDGNALKEIGQGTGAGAGTNTSGFSALLSGYRTASGFFVNLGYTYFWSSQEYNADNAYYLHLYDIASVIILGSSTDEDYGFSVRCLKD